MPKDLIRRVGIYVRISQDRDGTSAAPERQLADCRKLVEQRGWTIVDVYEDRDESGYSASAKRPAYKRMLADVEARRIDAVCVWKLDRLGRRLSETNRVVALLHELNAELLSVTENFDTTQPMGRAIIGFVSAQAETESQNISIRVRRAVADDIANGVPPKGGHRCFGYTKDSMIIEDEAEHLRTMAQLYADGVSLRQIARRMNDAGVLTTRQGRWEAKTVGQLLRSPRVGGYRRAADGKSMVRGNWVAVIEGDAWRALQAALSHSMRPAQAANVAKHLTTGLAHCGRCGCRLAFLKYIAGGVAYPRLSCVKEPGRDNCGRLAASESAVDRVVTEHLLHRLPTIKVAAVNVGALTAALAADQKARADLVEDRYVRRNIDQANYEATYTLLSERIAAAEVALEDAQLLKGVRMTVADLTKNMRPVGVRAKWAAADDDERRRLLRMHVARINIRPAAHKGGNVFDVERVEIVWRTPAPVVA